MRFFLIPVIGLVACGLLAAQAIETSAPCVLVPNDPTLGTANNYLAKVVNGNAVILAKSDGTAAGVVVSDGGKTGKACIASSGIAKVAIDGATTVGDVIQISTVSAGAGHDVGASATAFTVGQVLSTNHAAGVYDVLLNFSNPASGGGGGSSGTGNATSIVGIPVRTGTPVNGQAYVYSAVNHDLELAAVPVWNKTSISFTQFAGINATTGAANLFTRTNARQKLCGISVYGVSDWAAFGLTGISITIGDSTGSPAGYTPSPITLSATTISDINVMGSPSGSGTVQANFTAVGANLSALAGGSVDIDVCVISTP